METKKTYQAPTVREFEIKIRKQMLTGSPYSDSDPTEDVE